MSPQLLPLPRGGFPGVLSPAWAPSGIEAVRGAPGATVRLSASVWLGGHWVTGGSLSSLESDGDKDGDKDDWGAGMEEWGPQFEKLAQLFKEREKEKEEKGKCMENAKEDCEKKEGGDEGKD
ncbi:hypothetical protein WMY93_000871 [Mugilogobius chulae]|uniref:Cadherin Y-type LIR-motif domain-containing protein n=1 Tax=Mugilogobius chulae TaxID=88201 RepID=A0AAW0Q1M5_9GOBI